MDLRKYVPQTQADSGFMYRFIGPEDVGWIRQIEAMEEWLEGQVANILEKGGLCLIATKGGDLAGFNLADIGEVYMPLVNIRRVFREEEAWSVQISVDKKFRRMGLGSELRHRMFGELKRNGFRKFYGGTLSSNEANLRLTRSVGFQEIVDINYFRLFAYKNWFFRKVR
ncbi:MAG: hypothetical protein Kow00128_11920 [Deltaproteobacteria bacterium]